MSPLTQLTILTLTKLTLPSGMTYHRGISDLYQTLSCTHLTAIIASLTPKVPLASPHHALRPQAKPALLAAKILR